MSFQEALDRQRRGIDYSKFTQTRRANRTESNSPSVKSTSEGAIFVDRLRSKDPEAFEEMVRKFGSRLFATARRYLRSEADALDVLQDTFLCAFRSMGTFKGNSQLSTWLHRILINSALMHLRANKHRPDDLQVDIDQLLPHFDGRGHWVHEPAWTASVQKTLEVADTRSVVRRCIDRLPETYRVVLILGDIDELDTTETASLLGLTEANVKVRLHRARQALKAVLEREQLL